LHYIFRFYGTGYLLYYYILYTTATATKIREEKRGEEGRGEKVEKALCICIDILGDLAY